jgi:hypothetical protein
MSRTQQWLILFAMTGAQAMTMLDKSLCGRSPAAAPEQSKREVLGKSAAATVEAHKPLLFAQRMANFSFVAFTARQARPMPTLIALHVVAGATAIAAGAGAVWVVKGSSRHRQLGIAFAIALILTIASRSTWLHLCPRYPRARHLRKHQSALL